MGDDDASDDSDEWGMEELVIPPKAASAEASHGADNDDDDGDWAVKKEEESKVETPASQSISDDNDDGGNPMIIVDLTQMDANIHSKFDKNAVNDAEAASALRKKIEASYDEYAKDATKISDGTVIPCGSSVWRGALMRLRDERPGHYFAPIFPPKK